MTSDGKEPKTIGEWMAQQEGWKPGERRQIPRRLADSIRDEIASRVAPRIMAYRRAQADAYQHMKDMVIF